MEAINWTVRKIEGQEAQCSTERGNKNRREIRDVGRRKSTGLQVETQHDTGMLKKSTQKSREKGDFLKI